MEKIVLWCSVYGEGVLFSVEIELNAHVAVLQEKIFESQRYRERYLFPPSALTLYMACNKSAQWLASCSTTKASLKLGQQDRGEYVEMIPNWIIGKDYFGLDFQPGQHQIHVLVELPTDKKLLSAVASSVQFLDALALQLSKEYQFDCVDKKPTMKGFLKAICNDTLSIHGQGSSFGRLVYPSRLFTNDEWNTLLNLCQFAYRSNTNVDGSAAKCKPFWNITLPHDTFDDVDVMQVKSIAVKSKMIANADELIVKDTDGRIRTDPSIWRQVKCTSESFHGLTRAMAPSSFFGSNCNTYSLPSLHPISRVDNFGKSTPSFGPSNNSSGYDQRSNSSFPHSQGQSNFGMFGGGMNTSQQYAAQNKKTGESPFSSGDFTTQLVELRQAIRKRGFGEMNMNNRG